MAVKGRAIQVQDKVILEAGNLQGLLGTLSRKGFNLVGPTVRDGAIVYDELSSAADLPAGYVDEQDAAIYRIKKGKSAALFGYVVGPRSWKHYLWPPQLALWSAKRDGNGIQYRKDATKPPKYAFVGARSCELAAIAIQDRVFLEGKYVDPDYKARRDNVFIVAVNCGRAAGTCFCVSMKTGPKATSGFDVALTEILDGGHRFLAEAGTKRGADVLSAITTRKAGAEDEKAADRAVAKAKGQMGRKLDTKGIKELLYANLENPRWEEVGKRCLTCTNCTLVCPTCFCMTVEDTTDLTGEALRTRRWDSCFTLGHSYMAGGGSLRSSNKARYRQWLTHKLASWQDQFGTSGCVGCGRCITWCPAGIDITEEVAAIRSSQTPGKAKPSREGR